MTAATTDARFARRYAPTLFDRLVMRVSLTMLMWARHHSDRIAMDHEQYRLRFDAARELEHSRHESLMVIARLR